jgi:hypothetical protein
MPHTDGLTLQAYQSSLTLLILKGSDPFIAHISNESERLLSAKSSHSGLCYSHA